MHHAEPRHADLRPGDVEWEQHQEAEQRDSYGERNRRDDDRMRQMSLTCKDLKVQLKHISPVKSVRRSEFGTILKQSPAMVYCVLRAESSQCKQHMDLWRPGVRPTRLRVSVALLY